MRFNIDSERSLFQFDRSTVVSQLNALRRTIVGAATELQMVADERVFDKQLSVRLERRAKVLLKMAKSLNDLHVAVGQAQFPGKKNRPAAKPTKKRR